MKRYTREDMSYDDKMALIRRFGTVIEVVGNVVRVGIPSKAINDEPMLLEIYTGQGSELKEAE